MQYHRPVYLVVYYRSIENKVLFQYLSIAGGIIYAFGSNDYGQAVAPNTSNCYLPQRVNFNTNKKFTSVSCGSFHSAAITGMVYLGKMVNKCWRCSFVIVLISLISLDCKFLRI